MNNPQPMTKDELIEGMKEATRIPENRFFMLEVCHLLLGFIGDKNLLKEFARALSENLAVKSTPQDNYPKESYRKRMEKMKKDFEDNPLVIQYPG